MLIEDSKITVIIQGDIRPDLARAIYSVRQFLPRSRLILSTFDDEPYQTFAEFVDETVLSKDPGVMPPSVKANHASPNNTNRQLITSQAGLALVRTPYALKMRTDCVLHDTGFIHFLEEHSDGDPFCRRLVVSSFYTRHPRGLACYLFHVSDWFVFGLTERVRQFFSAPLVSLEDATWFERHTHVKASSYAASRFRARLTPEQHLTTHFASSLGYKIPRFLNDISTDLIAEYQSFLAKEVIVAYPSQLGFSVCKYPDIEKSLYQRVDCLGYSDWKGLHAAQYKSSRIKLIQIKSFASLLLNSTRYIANKLRRLIIRIKLRANGTKK